jgi:hypothetical protein
MLAAEEAMLHAREVALQSIVREEERRRADSAASDALSLEQLRRENAGLKQEVESLRREVQVEVQVLKNTTKSTGRPNP